MKEMKVKKKEEKETCSYKAFAVHRDRRMCIAGCGENLHSLFPRGKSLIFKLRLVAVRFVSLKSKIYCLRLKTNLQVSISLLSANPVQMNENSAQTENVSHDDIQRENIFPIINNLRLPNERNTPQQNRATV